LRRALYQCRDRIVFLGSVKAF